MCKFNIVQVRCDSDFVAMNADVTGLAEAVMQAISLVRSNGWDYLTDSQLTELRLEEPTGTALQDRITLCRTKFRENISLHAALAAHADPARGEILGGYLHQRVGVSAGRACGIVKLSAPSCSNRTDLATLANTLARQVVACQLPSASVDAFLESEYLFGAGGTVRDYIARREVELEGRVVVTNVAHHRIK